MSLKKKKKKNVKTLHIFHKNLDIKYKMFHLMFFLEPI